MTTTPADCDRTTVYAGECRNYSDTAWVPFESGRRRAPDGEYPWLVDSGTGSLWTLDTHVRNLVPLVPARPANTAHLESVIAEADGWLNTHRVSETWRTMSRLRDTLVRLAPTQETDRR